MEMEYGNTNMEFSEEDSLRSSIEVKEDDNLAKKENSDVSRWRYAVAAMLVITSGIVLAFTYSFMSRAEENEFRVSFRQSASTVIAASRFYAFNVIQTFEAMTDLITARTLRSTNKWPFVVFEDFELAAAHARITSFTEAVIFAPLVFGPFREEWETWASNHTDWIEESRSYADLTRSWLADGTFYDGGGVGSNGGPCSSCSGSETVADDYIRDNTLTPQSGDEISGEIFVIDQDQVDTCRSEPPCTLTRDRDRALYAPVWQVSPPPANPVAVGFNLFSDDMMSRIVSVLINSQVRTIITGLVDVRLLHAGIWSDEDHAGFHFQGKDDQSHASDPMTLPHSVVVTTVYSKLVGSTNNRIVGFVAAVIPWDIYFSRLLPEGVDGVFAVLESTCNSVSTYAINGPTATFLGNSDLHEPEFDYTRRKFDFNIFISSDEDRLFEGDVKQRPCEYTLSLYASQAYRKRFYSSQTGVFMTVLGSVFVVTGAVFIMFLRYVGRRNTVVMETAVRTNAIVASLFPSNVRDRVLESNEGPQHLSTALGAKQRLRNFLNGDVDDAVSGSVHDLKSKPIADLFPAATIMFCDMVGFTAWSSTRAPTDVFGLLEKVYGAFDERAKRRKVFKVETVGDQYVAVTGLPQPMKDHAVVCCRFAAECSTVLDSLVKELEVEFGPDTGDLNMRFGLHSGPVTAGVLRGERSRFQLFGDTVNTASRLESTGVAGRIQVSEETAALLVAAGKGHWLRPREEKVTAKGKGELSTYWLEKKEESVTRSKSIGANNNNLIEAASEVEVQPGALSDRNARLVDYNVDVMMRLLRSVSARRQALGIRHRDVCLELDRLGDKTVLDEVKETIALPAFNARAAAREVDPWKVQLGEKVEDELRHYVTTIASLYNDNSFHCFEHCSHVAMSVTKLMARIVAPDMEVNDQKKKKNYAHKLHDNTHGITSDPLTQFACVYSALIHDVDHLGVPNTQLALEHPELAKRYKNKSIAEQHSVDLSWELLMQPFYQNLQKAIFASPDEYRRFRELVVNSVMATDIMDPDLKKLRNNRWDRAFDGQHQESEKEAVDRRATIVIEHIIQASDVSHCMQHWHIYRKWNERLFEEMYKAHLLYRSEKNPADNWVASEIGFFDFYIIPLAKKLKDCGVFGVSSFEYLDYAQRNRDEWKAKGEQIVAEMVRSVNDKLFQRQEI